MPVYKEDITSAHDINAYAYINERECKNRQKLCSERTNMDTIDAVKQFWFTNKSWGRNFVL